LRLKFVDPFFDLFFRLTGLLLQTAKQFIFFAFFVQQIIIGQISILLLDLAF